MDNNENNNGKSTGNGNLKFWKKGQSGNPNGRPKKLPELDKLLINVLGDKVGDIEAAEAILNAMKAKALKGDTKAAELLLNRAYGAAKQTIDSNVYEHKTPSWFNSHDPITTTNGVQKES